MKPTLVLDIECYSNYFLVMFKSIDSRKVRHFEMYEDITLDKAKISHILQTYRIVTFNGINYDMPMLTYALKGASCTDLKAASDAIITQGLKSWQFEKTHNVKVPSFIDHIDLIETVPGVAISLKLYGARMHSKRLQDLPYDPAEMIDADKRTALRTYCENDLDITIDLWLTATDPKDNIIETRERLGNEFGIDLRSKSDAQIAEAIIKARVSKLKDAPIFRQEIAAGTAYKYTAPKFIKFNNPLLQTMFADILDADFVVAADGKVAMPDALEGAKITIGKSTYKLGIGGLHSTEKSKGHITTSSTFLRDRDVVSYYPSLILQCGLFPSNMGNFFQQVYKDFFDRRVAAKRTGHKSTSQTLKILLNGAYGKLGSPWSVLYSPNLMIQVTVTGQLAMLMMVERMEIAGIPCISANTDGIVMACPAALEPSMLAIVKQWEDDTGLETEESAYRALFSRDVNNYIALKVGKGWKTKGVLSEPGVQKNPANMIVNDAVVGLLEYGTPIAQTILGCLDIRRFLRVQRVTGGAKHAGEYLGKVCRWYRGKGASRYIEYVKNGNKVANSDGAVPLMELPDTLPIDIDYEFYITEANDLLREIGAV